MKLTLYTLLFAALFLAVPLATAAALHIRFLPRIWKAALRTVLLMVAEGGLLWYLFREDNILLNVLFVLLAIIFSTLVAVVRARVGTRTGFVPVLAGMCAGVVAVGLCTLGALAGTEGMFHTRYLVPVMGMMAGCATVTCGRALGVYYTGLRKHSQLYFYLLGNGATHAEALHHFFRRAVESALLPGADRMAAAVAGLSPYVVWTALMCGTDVLTAIALFALLVSATYCAGTVAVIVAVRVAQWYGVDEYSRLKNR